MTSRSFPEDFIWGVATAGHQIEGDNVNSDTWFLEQLTPSVFREPSGRACNSYELWETDLQLVVDLGLNAYRFSVEWARVEPEPGHFSTDALDHYDAIVDGCHRRGLAPIVTFNHFTSPHWFAMRGRLPRRRRAGDVRPLLRACDGGVRRPHRLCRHAQRAKPLPAAVLDESSRLHPRARASDPRRCESRGGRRALPGRQRRPVGGLRWNAAGLDRRSPCREVGHQGPP